MGIFEDKAKEAYERALRSGEAKQREYDIEALRQKRDNQRGFMMRQFEGLFSQLENPSLFAAVTYTDSDTFGFVATLAGETSRYTTIEVPSKDFGGKATQLAMLGNCPQCGKETTSRPVLLVEDIGELLNHFSPGNDHKCDNQ